MRIVSQKRDFSFDFDRTMFWKQDKFIYAHIVGVKRDIVIGNYKSEERAAEVFEDIHKYCTGDIYMFKNVEIAEDFKNTMERLMKNAIHSRFDSAEPEIKRLSNGVYYMPEE